MLIFSKILFGFCLAWFLGQAVLVARFCKALRNFRTPLVDDGEAPLATIVLALRGTDPSLADSLEAIWNQDYPNFDVRVVLDQPDDPAAAVLQETMNRLGEHKLRRTEILVLEEPARTCSLKCSCLVQAYRSISDDCEFIASVDADTVPHATWLRELATGLRPAEIGVATGNRWYVPQSSSICTLIRFIWNAAAIVQMHAYQICWGGSLAIKTKVIEECELIPKWSSAFCEDTMLFAQIRNQGYSIKFVPSLMMSNREDCQFPGFFKWLVRQLINARLYHPLWLAVVMHGLGTALLQLLLIGMIAWSASTGEWLTMSWSLAAFATYQGLVALLLVPMSSAIRQIMGFRDEPIPPRSIRGYGALGLAIIGIQVVYPVALACAVVARRVSWRGIEYRVRGPWSIEMLEYQPFQTPPGIGDSHSL